MVRDAVSGNTNNSVHFIDYQGGMKGAPQYDVASMLWQAKANLPDSWKNNLLNDYMTSFEEILESAKRLSAEQRLRLADALLALEQPGNCCRVPRVTSRSRDPSRLQFVCYPPDRGDPRALDVAHDAPQVSCTLSSLGFDGRNSVRVANLFAPERSGPIGIT
jgi:hypothetical protein